MSFPTKQERPDGLHQKYVISKADGSPVDDNAVYFVLRLDGSHIHNVASREAAKTWADMVLGTPQLGQVAVDLLMKIKELE